jgi:hypothetical protein
MANPAVNTNNFIWDSSASTLNSTFYVDFPKAPDFELLLIGAELEQDIHHHDRLTLQFKGRPFVRDSQISSGDPVIFTYASGKVMSKFKGYVHHIDQLNNMTGANTTIVCVSASYVLKNTDQKIYKDTTADQVVKKIAAKHGMSCTVQRHPRIRAAIVQAGQTDWQLCTSLAKQTGFALVHENTHITFVSKNKIYATKKPSASYFFMVDDPITGIATMADKMSGTLFNFRPIISDESPETGIVVDRAFSGSSNVSDTDISTTHSLPDTTSSNTGSVIPSEAYFQ